MGSETSRFTYIGNKDSPEVPSTKLEYTNSFKLKGSQFGVVRQALAQTAQRRCWCPISGGIQGWEGWGPGQPDGGGVPAHSRGLKMDDL